MAIDYEQLRNWPIPDARQDYAERDTMLYALALGIGENPVDPDELRYVYERDLEAFATFPVVVAMGGSWTRDPGTGINYGQLLHAEQQFELHRPMPVRGSVVSRSRVIEVIDKGAGRGAIAISERRLFVDGESSPTATLRSSSFCRADGGFGGPVTESAKAHAIPDRPADHRVAIRTLRQAALIYRLSGDYNELHSDPEVAAAAGFREPILHGLCSFGVAVRGALAAAGLRSSQVRAGGTRFTAPVYPGETLETEVWRDGDTISFRTTIADRAILALNHGWLRIAA